VLSARRSRCLSDSSFCGSRRRARQKASKAFRKWSELSASARVRYLMKFGQKLHDNAKSVSEIVTREQGKVTGDADGEVFRSLEILEHAYGMPSLQMGEMLENVAQNMNTYSLRQPLGVVAGIVPFNFPVMMPMWMVPLAIATGNCFILKPSEKVPGAMMRIMEIAVESGIPDGVLSVIHGAKPTVDFICDHPKIRSISFVGGNQA